MRYPGLLLDLEGVLYQEDAPIPGAAAALSTLRRQHRVRFLTNTTTRPRRQIAERLQSMGFEVAAEEVFSPPIAAARLLRKIGAKRIHLAAAPALAEDLADFELDLGADHAGGGPPAPPDAVVLGDLYREFTWDRLNDLFTMLAAGAPLIALHRNRVSRRASGIALDLGPFVAALEYAADVRAHIVGKPSRQFFGLAVASLDLDPSQVLMVGDDIGSDIGGALGAGLAAVQVRTGKYRPRDDHHPTATPAGRIDSIADLAPWLTRGEAR
jgi:phospholysine phosphohistidine inorganic pyrophosphate phosphatase